MLVHKRSHRKRFFLMATAVFVGAYSAMTIFQHVPAAMAKTYQQESPLPADKPTPLKKSPVHLYFIERSNYFLKSEYRVVVHAEGRVNIARAIVEALIRGPQEDLLKTLPSATRLNAIYVSPDNICYVDMSEEIRSNHPGGISTELLTIYSIVNSLILNIADIDRVKILIDGNEAHTLAGHISLQFPAKANMLLIR
jgi:spore germination protein GerM